MAEPMALAFWASESVLTVQGEAWLELLRDAAVSLATNGHETERIQVTWEDGEPFGAFTNLPQGFYGLLRVFSSTGRYLAEFTVGYPVEGFPEWVQPFEIPEGGGLRLPLRIRFENRSGGPW